MLDDLYQEGTERVVRDLARRPAPAQAPDAKFSIWSAPRAMGSAAAAFGAEGIGFYADVVGAFGEALATTEGGAGGMFSLQSPAERTDSLRAADKIAGEGLSFSSETGDLFRNVGRGYRMDPATAHVAERVIFDLTRGLLKVGTNVMAMGPAGALLAAADEGSMVADDLKQQGVDLGTRTAVGALSGAALGVGAVLPLAGTTVAKTAGLYALGGPVGFMAQQQATRAILEAADYGRVAEQFDPFDPVGLAVATLLPAPFAVYGFRRLSSKVTPEQVDAAMAHNLTLQQDAREANPLPVQPREVPDRPADQAPIETKPRTVGDSQLDIPTRLGDDGEPVTAKAELERIRQEAKEGTDVELGTLDADLIQVASECALSLGLG